MHLKGRGQRGKEGGREEGREKDIHTFICWFTPPDYAFWFSFTPGLEMGIDDAKVQPLVLGHWLLND